MFSLEVYSVADMVKHADLKSEAEDKVDMCIAEMPAYKLVQFPAFIRKAYKVAQPGPTGDRLRDMVVQYVAKHAKAALEGNQVMSKLMEEVSAFGRDLALALVKCHPTIPNSPEKRFMFLCMACAAPCVVLSSAPPGDGFRPACPSGCPGGGTNAQQATGLAPRRTMMPVSGDWCLVTYRCDAGHRFRARKLRDQSAHRCPFCANLVWLSHAEAA